MNATSENISMTPSRDSVWRLSTISIILYVVFGKLIDFFDSYFFLFHFFESTVQVF